MIDQHRADAREEWMIENVANYEEVAFHYPYSLPTRALKFDSVADMRRKVAESGSPFFSRATMQFFRTTIVGLYGGRFVVTGDRRGDEYRYTVRYFVETNGGEGPALSAEYIGDYGTYEDKADAVAKAKEAARVLRGSIPPVR